VSAPVAERPRPLELPVFSAAARGILTRTSGFIREAGFTHSLTPARNCTYGCTYCYVPTMGLYGGLRPDDWRRWGQFTTFKENAAALLRRELRPGQIIYCSPLVDPYQPAESRQGLMPEVLRALADRPPRRFVLQTRGPLIVRDLDLLLRLARVTPVCVSFSLTTNREEIRRWYEPHTAPFAERLRVMGELRRAGLRVFATLAPLLPCDPEQLAQAALEASAEPLIADPLHVRDTKPQGATTRAQAFRIAQVRGHTDWWQPAFQAAVVDRLRAAAARYHRGLHTGPDGFRLLIQDPAAIHSSTTALRNG
jgi:DNA repair photolyase